MTEQTPETALSSDATEVRRQKLALLRDKIVLLGTTAPGLQDLRATQNDDEFDSVLGGAIDRIQAASVT